MAKNDQQAEKQLLGVRFKNMNKNLNKINSAKKRRRVLHRKSSEAMCKTELQLLDLRFCCGCSC